MAEKQEKSPFTSLFTPDFYAEWRTNMKYMLSSSLEAHEKTAKQALALYEKTMSWTKDTPWAPWCESVVTTTEKLVENVSALMRSMWHIKDAREGPEKMSKV